MENISNSESRQMDYVLPVFLGLQKSPQVTFQDQTIPVPHRAIVNQPFDIGKMGQQRPIDHQMVVDVGADISLPTLDGIWMMPHVTSVNQLLAQYDSQLRQDIIQGKPPQTC